MQPNLDLSGSAYAFMLRNLPQILFPLVLLRMALADTILQEVRRRSLCPFLWALGYFWPFSTRLRGRIGLVFPSLPETDPLILERTGFAREDMWVESHQAMDLFLPEFYLCDVVCSLRIARHELVSKLLCPSVKSNWISAARRPELRNPIVVNSSAWQPHLHHVPFFGLLLGWRADLRPADARKHIYRRTCIPTAFCNSDIREDAEITTSQRDSDLWDSFFSKISHHLCLFAALKKERFSVSIFHV